MHQQLLWDRTTKENNTFSPKQPLIANSLSERGRTSFNYFQNKKHIHFIHSEFNCFYTFLKALANVVTLFSFLVVFIQCIKLWVLSSYFHSCISCILTIVATIVLSCSLSPSLVPFPFRTVPISLSFLPDRLNINVGTDDNGYE